MTIGPSVYWYLTRATGAVALVLLTLSVVVGVAAVGRVHSRLWPRFVVDGVHRSSSLLAVAFVLVHIVTSVLDGFAPIAWLDAVIPFAGAYRPLWLGLGAVSFDLLLAVLITSLMRARLGYAGWRAVHWLAYASWPVALIHGFGTGSDVNQAWMLLISIACTATVLVSVVARVIIGWPAQLRLRLSALGAAALFALGLVAWLPGGPLGKHWARRAGTPKSLLAPHASPGGSA
ncbi:MAG TPA: ferric reductase-like transmembrane domain-containing protein [Solirubrobacteraceae bacterium]